MDVDVDDGEFHLPVRFRVEVCSSLLLMGSVLLPSVFFLPSSSTRGPFSPLPRPSSSSLPRLSLLPPLDRRFHTVPRPIANRLLPLRRRLLSRRPRLLHLKRQVPLQKLPRCTSKYSPTVWNEVQLGLLHLCEDAFAAVKAAGEEVLDAIGEETDVERERIVDLLSALEREVTSREAKFRSAA